MEWLTQALPNWLTEWLRIYVAPLLKVPVRVLLRTLLLGVRDTILFISLPITISMSSQAIWDGRYHLTLTQQEQVEQWASISTLIAYIEDVPPMVPLVLWYKESSLQAINPNNCEGIMGLHSAVSTGELPCFPAGPISAWEVTQQLQLGARTFKEYCPEISYATTDPRIIKQCYLYYNAGPRSRIAPNSSAYVMNGYDARYQNMILTDVQGKQYRLMALGAWPVHLAIQTQLSQRREPRAPAALLAPIMLGQELVDKAWTMTEDTGSDVVLSATAEPSTCRAPEVYECFVMPHTEGDKDLRPIRSPLLIPPTQSGELMCGLLPGVDLVPTKASIVLAPMPGTLTRYTDGMGHLAIQIENAEWTVWITGLRAYTTPEGEINTGDAIGTVGGAGSQTPGVHYAIYDKTNAGFVDALSFIPADHCPSTG